LFKYSVFSAPAFATEGAPQVHALQIKLPGSLFSKAIFASNPC
jgi:hypothetical protein